MGQTQDTKLSPTAPEGDVHTTAARPRVAKRGSYRVAVTAGVRYIFCTCGYSADQPFCDGQHKGTGFRPKVYIPDADGTIAFCGCKHTQSGVLCDGTHRQLDDGASDDTSPS